MAKWRFAHLKVRLSRSPFAGKYGVPALLGLLACRLLAAVTTSGDAHDRVAAGVSAVIVAAIAYLVHRRYRGLLDAVDADGDWLTVRRGRIEETVELAEVVVDDFSRRRGRRRVTLRLPGNGQLGATVSYLANDVAPPYTRLSATLAKKLASPRLTLAEMLIPVLLVLLGIGVLFSMLRGS